MSNSPIDETGLLAAHSASQLKAQAKLLIQRAMHRTDSDTWSAELDQAERFVALFASKAATETADTKLDLLRAIADTRADLEAEAEGGTDDSGE